MTDETPLAGSAGAETPEPEKESKVIEAPESEGAKPADTPDEAKADDGAASDEKGDEKPKENRSQERFDKLTARRREAERRAADAEGEAARLRERLKRYETPAPKESEFGSYDEYQAALSAHNSRQVFKQEHEDDARDAEDRAKAATNEAASVAQEAFRERAEEFASRVPDFHEKVNDPSLPVTGPMRDQILASDNGPQVAYYLATHRSEAAQIAGLTSEREVARAIGRIEGRLSVPPPRKVTQAPTPIKPVATGSGSQGSFDPSKASVDDIDARLRARGVIG